MEIYKPLHLGFNHQVLEHNKQFHFIASVTMGVSLSTGESLLETSFLKDAIENMGAKPLPDVGMPKPCGEYLVSGKYFSPGNKEVTGGEVKVKIGPQKKSLYVFGTRTWEMGVPSKAEPITSMPIEYSLAYGGNGLETNIDGMGYKEDQLPCIENPQQLIDSPNSKTEPAGYSVLDPNCSQRMRFQGTYDNNYLQNYFPGYPPDFDWQYFMVAPQDQWTEGYYQGNESFELHNMHPDVPELKGQLSGYFARCFLKQLPGESAQQFSELLLNLDTIWFFPEADLALLIWRGGMEVKDNEADQVTDVLLAFESQSDPKRSLDYYQQALEKRINSDDFLLNNFNTEDLIPLGVKCAMQLLQEDAFSDDKESAFSENLDAKIETTQALIKEKTDELVEQSKSGIESASKVDKNVDLDIEQLLKNPEKPVKDPDVEAFNAKLEKILPGITSGDVKKLQLKNFSFDKISKIMAEVEALTSKKTSQAQEEIDKAMDQLKKQLEEEKVAAGNASEASEEINEILKMMDQLDAKEEKFEGPLPRLNAKEITDKLSELNPDTTEAMQHLQAMKAAGIDNEQTQKMEELLNQSLNTQQQEIEEGLKEAESAFRETYIMGAHYMVNGTSPHAGSLDEVAERFLQDLKHGKSVAGGDWACIDLSGKNLDHIDLSNCLLEQVNFTGSSLKGANLSGAIMARAILIDADLTGANLEGANIGSVKANNANFTDAIIINAKLSKADFKHANFTRCHIENIESLELSLNHADFSEAMLPALRLVEVDITGAKFTKANLTESAFLQCSINDVDFQQAIMPGCIWADTLLDNVNFNEADLSKNCFAATEPDKIKLTRLSFIGACLDRSNFQGMNMPGSDFSKASLDNAMFSNADLTQSNFSRANAPQAQFRKARLTNSNMTEINLMEGSLAKAHLSGASFAKSNLYAVDFMYSFMGDTDFSGCNLERTLIQDWRPS